jgi:hypothetical protein
MYKLQETYDILSGTHRPQSAVVRIADGAVIPFDPANTDYQAFLRWCDEGGVPEPADEVTE